MSIVGKILWELSKRMDNIYRNKKIGNNRYHCVVSLELNFYVNADNENEAVNYLENMELPKEYRENSFDIKFIEKIKHYDR